MVVEPNPFKGVIKFKFKGSAILFLRKMFLESNISYPLYAHFLNGWSLKENSLAVALFCGILVVKIHTNFRIFLQMKTSLSPREGEWFVDFM